MSAHALLRRLRSLGFEVERVADDVKLRGPVATLPPAALATIRRHKPLLLVALTCGLCRRPLAPDEAEAWWGEDRVHRRCGEEAWRHAWRG